MNKKGVTLLEILIASIILASVVTGLLAVFISGKKYILHSRSRMTAGELGKYFLGPLQGEVRQDEWDAATNDYKSTNDLSMGQGKPGNPMSLDKVYTPHYSVSALPNFPQARKVKVEVKWAE